METRWLPVSLVVCGHRPGTGTRRPPAGAVRESSGPGCSSPAAAAPAPVWLRGCGAGRDFPAYLLPARQRRSQDPGPRRGAAPHPPGATPGRGPRTRRWSSPSTTRPPSGMGRRSRPRQASRRRGRPGPSSSTAMSGYYLARLVRHRPGERSACRSSRTCTSGPRMSAGWRPTTAGSSAPSWSWPPPKSSGWCSSGGPSTPPIWVVTDGAYAKRPFLKRAVWPRG